jgi:hypothetical protein
VRTQSLHDTRPVRPDNGGWRSRDHTGTAEEVVDDSVTWGKRSARTRRLARWKESRIGEAMLRLADGEWTVAAYHCWGEGGQRKGKKLGLATCLYSRRRELRGGPLESASGAGVESDWRAIGARRFPLFPSR